MRTVRFAQGVNDPDRIAFGLPAPQLFAVATTAAVAYLVAIEPLTGFVTVPAAGLLLVLGVALGWGSLWGRPALDVAVAGAAYVARSHRRPIVLFAADRGDDIPRDAPWARWLTDDDAADGPDADAPAVPRRAGGAGGVTGAASAAEADPPSTGGGSAPPPSPFPAPPPSPSDREDSGEEEDGPVILPFARALADDDDYEDGDDDLPDMSPVAPPVTHEAAAPVFVGATRRLTFFALNGGTGRTTLATEVAAVLAAHGRHSRDGHDSEPLRVALIDLDVRSATVAVRLGVPAPTIWDYVMQRDTDGRGVTEYMVSHRSGLRALLGPPKPVSGGRGIEPAHVAEIVHELEAAGYHFIIFDVAADLNALTTWVLEAVHDIHVVLTPTASGVQDAYRTTEALRRMGLRHKLSYVINRARPGMDMREVMGDLGGRILAAVPYDAAVDDCENSHRLVTQGTSPAAAALRTLAAHAYPPLQSQSPRRAISRWWRRRAV